MSHFLLNPFISFPAAAGGDAPTFQGATDTSTLSQSTIATDATPTDGDFLLLGIENHAWGDPTPVVYMQSGSSKPMTLHLDQESTLSGQQREMFIFWGIWNTGDLTTFTIDDGTPNTRHATLLRYSGAHETTPFHAEGGTSGSLTCPSVSLSVECEIVRVLFSGNDYATCNTAAGTTRRGHGFSLSGADDTWAIGTDDVTQSSSSGTMTWSGPSSAAICESWTFAIRGPA